MNERIKELEKLAMIRVNNPIVNSDGKVICDDWEEGISISKFAELIVRECGSYLNSPEFIGRSDLDWAMVLNEHFGVEE